MNSIDNLQYYLKDLTEPSPPWTSYEKQLIAWALCWEGWIGLYGGKPQVGICTWDEKMMLEWMRIVRFGRLYEKKTRVPCRKRWSWQMDSVRDVHYLLNQIFPFLPAKKYQAMKVINYCMKRIEIEK